MDRLMIRSNGPISGEVRINGAKNAALPILAAGLLVDGHVSLTNLPPVRDVETMCFLLERMGIKMQRGMESVYMRCENMRNHIAPYELVKTMRASILVLGPLLARLGRARVSLPGGCAIGARPVDQHIKALCQMGAEIEIEEGYIEARTDGLRGTDFTFDKVTVTGTENIMMAATLAEGTTILRNVALEPEVVDLAEMLNTMGARISGQGTNTITIEGVPKLAGGTWRIMPDRIETGTYLCAAAITGGHLTVTNTRSDFLDAFLAAMERASVPIKVHDQAIEVFSHEGLTATDIITDPHPGFPTDLQAQFMAMMTQANGTSRVTETIFENRFQHVPELNRMGANIVIEGNSALIHGPTPLNGAQVMATDLRASASLVIAGLATSDATIVDRIYHLDRGYTQLERKLSGVNGEVRRLRARKANVSKTAIPIVA